MTELRERESHFLKGLGPARLTGMLHIHVCRQHKLGLIFFKEKNESTQVRWVGKGVYLREVWVEG